jgi:hypothetical protein
MNSRKLVIASLGSITGVIGLSSMVYAQNGNHRPSLRHDTSTTVMVQTSSPSTSADDKGGSVTVATRPKTTSTPTVAGKGGTDDPAAHDVTDDKGTDTIVSDDPAGHEANDATDDNGSDTALAGTTATSIDDHGGARRNGTTTTIPEHAGTIVARTPAPTTATSVDSHDTSGRGGNGSSNDGPRHG